MWASYVHRRDASGGSLTGMFKQTFVFVDGKSYGEKDYNSMGRTGLSVAFSFPSTFGPLLQDNFQLGRKPAGTLPPAENE